jgi:cytochrome c oxidase subunit 2
MTLFASWGSRRLVPEKSHPRVLTGHDVAVRGIPLTQKTGTTMITALFAVQKNTAVYPVFDPHSPYARSIASLGHGVLYVMLGILIVVVGLVSYCTWRFREKPGQASPKPIYGNVKLELGYTITFVILLGVISVFSIRSMGASDPPSHQPINLLIVAHQWWWEVHYPKTDIVTANEIHVPVNQPERVGFRSADVIHDFWVPELGRKIDIIPGVENHSWFSADTPGTYYGRCAEYCGKEHAWMRILVIAQTSADFAKWEQEQEAVPAAPTGGAAAQGAKYFQEMSCASCHAIRGTDAHASIGPDLTHVASRQTLAAGRLENTEANLRDWLHEPDKLKPGCKMPNLHLTGEQLNSLVAYLETLK